MRRAVFILFILAAMRAESAADDSSAVDVYPLETDSSEAPAITADTETGYWLQLQSSGAIAGPRYTLPGKAATNIYRRYLDSFTHKVPEQFDFKRSSISRSRSGSGTGR
jgi:hypothetical protein